MVMAGQQNYARTNEYDDRKDILWEKGKEGLTENPNRTKAARHKNACHTPMKIGAAIVALIIINLVFQAMLIQKNYEMRVVQGKIGDLKRQMVEVRMDMARLESFDRIQEIAQNELGMKVAGNKDYRYIAAAPQVHSANEAYAKRVDSAPKANLWAKVNSWIANSGATMAQNQ